MLDQCPYLVSRVTGKRTAEDWGHLMADAADMMDAKSRRLMIEQWTAPEIHVKKPQPKRPAQRKPAQKKPIQKKTK